MSEAHPTQPTKVPPQPRIHGARRRSRDGPVACGGTGGGGGVLMVTREYRARCATGTLFVAYLLLRGRLRSPWRVP